MSACEVVVIGGGFAGLVAALVLARAGRRVELVEASDRLGGRAHTVRAPDWPLPIELGAEFLHGKAEPTRRWLQSAGIATTRLVDRHHWRDPADAGRGLQALSGFWGRIHALLARVDRSAADCSAATFAARQLRGPDRALFELFVRGFQAAPLEQISLHSLAREAEEAAEDHAQFRVQGGYGALVAWLARELEGSGCRVHVGARVRRVRWQRGQVQLELEDAGSSRQLSAVAVVLSVPAAVLGLAPARGGIAFDPGLSQKMPALEHIGTSQVRKLVLRFREPFWDERAAPGFEFLHDASSAFLSFWRQSHGKLQQLTAWAGDPRAGTLRSGQGAEQQALAELCVLLGCPIERATRCLLGSVEHDFTEDERARGAYSHLRVGGAGAGAQQQLAQPIERTLFFAGEATDADYPGTVAGAIQSGERAARELLGCGLEAKGLEAT